MPAQIDIDLIRLFSINLNSATKLLKIYAQSFLVNFYLLLEQTIPFASGVPYVLKGVGAGLSQSLHLYQLCSLMVGQGSNVKLVLFWLNGKLSRLESY